MIGDTSENIGANAWTKLLDDKDSPSSNNPEITKSTVISEVDFQKCNTKEDTLLPLERLKGNCSNLSSGEGGVVGGNTISDSTVGETKSQLSRKGSVLGSFHKHLRRSLKAVSESPGPITR